MKSGETVVRSPRFKTPEPFIVSLLILIGTLLSFQACSTCSAEEKTTIVSDTLEYEKETSLYRTKGHVTIQQGMTSVKADEIIYQSETSETTAEGAVIYDDPSVTITAKRAELNLEFKTGTLYEATVFSKKDKYRIAGREIEKIDEDEYTIKKASFTTCDAPVPAWCFRGNDVDVVVGDQLKAKDVTFAIKDRAVFYSPYFLTAIGTERKTGLLIPTIGYINSKGIHYEQPFFWAISENRDATFVLDAYGKKGVGQGLEYRFIEPNGAKGYLWTYHIRDSSLDHDLWDLRGIYENRAEDRKVNGFLNLNYINSRDFYTEYYPYVNSKARRYVDSASYLSMTTERFLESTGEVSYRFDNSRAYLISEYFVDLKQGVDKATVLQTLPELGYFMNPRRIGPVVFSLTSNASNFWREQGVSGQRIDIYPRLGYSVGSEFVIAQTLGLRETAYSLSDSGNFGTSPHRESLDYTITGFTRLIKRYGTLTHIIEPTLGFTYIPSAGSNLPLFDSTELYSRTAKTELSLYNRFMDTHGEFLALRISQAYDSYRADRPFLPLKLDIAMVRPAFLRADFTYDFSSGRVEDVNSDIGIRVSQASLTIGERYSRIGDILSYVFGFSYAPLKILSAEGTLWYDARGGGIRDMMAKIKYQAQCWGVALVLAKRQNDKSVSVLIDLLGLGTMKF